MTVNLHRVFTGESQSGSYLKALQIDGQRDKDLRDARDEVRETLKAGFSDVTSYVNRQALFESNPETLPTLRPKFRMQGSFAYHTCNAPAQVPPQEIDLDDGVFLPVSFLSGNGQYHPDLASDGYFAAVERMLEPLCSRKGWTLEADKPSCVRIRLEDDVHIDLALYAIPDQQFTQLQEAMDSVDKAVAGREMRNALELVNEVYQRLPEDKIMLAHREQGWKPSDPRKLDDWVHANLDEHGEQFRRVSRYLKGWRDYTWEESRLSSIALMSAVATTMEEANGSIPQNRDDLAVKAVAEKLPTILAGRIDNPVVQGQRFDEGWDALTRQDYIKKAETFRDAMRSSLATGDPELALEALATAFGDRIPDDQTLVEMPMETKSHSGLGSALGATVVAAGLLKTLGDGEEARAAVQKGGDTRYA